MKRIFTIFTALILLTILLAPLSSIQAEEKNRDMGERYGNPPPPPKDGEMRLMGFKMEQDKVIVFSAGKQDKTMNIFYFTLDTEKAPVFHFNYFRMPDSEMMERYNREMNENRSFRDKQTPGGAGGEPGKFPVEELGMSVKIRGLTEFNDSNKKISSYDFSQAQFRQPVVTPRKEGERVQALEIKTGTTDGIFGLKIIIYASYTKDQAMGALGPYEIKYDIMINDYPFAGNDSYLALDNGLSMPEAPVSPFSREFERDQQPKPFIEQGLGYEKSSASMFFAWATNVTVDGQEHDVEVEYTGRVSGEGSSVESMSFIYPAGASIYHDPKIGVADLLEDAEEGVERLVELILSWSTGLGVGLIAVAAVGLKHKQEKFDWED